MTQSVLCLVRYYLPGFKSGGPVRTVSNITEHLGDEFAFRIVTSDRDLLDECPYPGVKVDQWNVVGKAQVFYASRRYQSISGLSRLIRATPHDVLYLNSFFDPVFTLRPLLARRFRLIPRKAVVVAPRGEFSKGAFDLKLLKKRTYVVAANAIGLYRDVIWQASSDHESKDIQRVMGVAPGRIMVAPDLGPVVQATYPVEQPMTRSLGPLRICFLSRISPKKNLDFALRVLRKVEVPVTFDVYGPIEDWRYWAECQAFMRAMPDHIVVRFHGPIDHSQVHVTLRQYDLFFFPTRGENFGHVILESLLAGTPVLISDCTPWRDLHSLGVGWDVALDDEGAYVAAIKTASLKTVEEYGRWRRYVADYGARIIKDASVVEASRRLFRTFGAATEVRGQ